MPDRDKAAVVALRRLGHVVAKRRLLGDKTQERMAEAAGVSEQFLRRVERGTGNPSYLTLLRLADALEVPLEELVREAKTLDT
jgi:transcriptional regulator with XRE-family HTH domain